MPFSDGTVCTGDDTKADAEGAPVTHDTQAPENCVSAPVTLFRWHPTPSDPLCSQVYPKFTHKHLWPGLRQPCLRQLQPLALPSAQADRPSHAKTAGLLNVPARRTARIDSATSLPLAQRQHNLVHRSHVPQSQ